MRRENLIRILESEERFRQVFHQTNDAILLYEVAADGRDHRCLEANEQACRWLGYSQDELRRHRPADLIEPPATGGPAPWDRPEPGPFRFDACFRRRDGPTTAVVSLHRFNLLGREVMLVVARDVAEERRREQEQVDSLRQIQQNMEQFQILNDQIRNPVQVIIGLADMEGGRRREPDHPAGPRDRRDRPPARRRLARVREGDGVPAPVRDLSRARTRQSRSWISRAAPRTRNPTAASGRVYSRTTVEGGSPVARWTSQK